MNLRDVEAFLVIAEGASVVAAGQRLHMTPSAVSKALRRLEGELGATLFSRDGHRLVLSADGERFLVHARTLVETSGRARDEASGRTVPDEVRIAGPGALLAAFAPTILDALREVAPTARIALDAAYESEAVERLASGRCELALITGDAASVLTSAVERQRLAGFRTVLAARDERVADAPVACGTVSPWCGQARRLQSTVWLRSQGLPDVDIRVDDLMTLLTLVKSGRARALLPDFLAASEGFSSFAFGGAETEEEEDGWVNQLSKV